MRVSKKLSGRIMAGLLSVAMVFTLMFATINVQATNEPVELIRIGVMSYTYKSMENSVFLSRDSKINYFYVPRNSTDEDIRTAIDNNLDRPENINDSVRFDHWSISSRGEGQDEKLYIVNAEYNCDTGNLYKTRIRYVKEKIPLSNVIILQ